MKIKDIDKIKIGCINYTVEITDKPIIIDDKCGYTGMIDYINCKISLDMKNNEELQSQILWHELMHGIATDKEVNFKEMEEETIINLLAKGILSILQDNPMLTKLNDAI